MRKHNQVSEDKKIDLLLKKKRKFIEKTQHSQALRIATIMLKAFPRNLVAQYSYAVTLGDYQEGLSQKQIEKNRKTAAKILKKVVEKIELVPEDRRKGILNEYFWFSRQPLKQYQHGVLFVRQGENRGYYSQGVGAIAYAQSLAIKGDFKSVKLWAQKSKKAWENYFKIVPDYYNAWCWYALALGVLGLYDEMNQALRKASTLSGRGWDYSEFKEFQWMVWNTKFQLRKKLGKKARKHWELPPCWHVSNLDFRAALLKIFAKEPEKGFIWTCKEAQKLPKKFPKETYARIFAAALYGDWGQMLSEQKEKQMKAQAVRKLEKLLPRIQTENLMLQEVFWNEIYYHSGQYLKQYQLGLKTNLKLPGQGYFSMGVGASELAYRLYLKGKNRDSKKWGQKAVESWKLHSPNSATLADNCFYIQALALSGEKKKAQAQMSKILKNEKIYQLGPVWFDKYQQRLNKLS